MVLEVKNPPANAGDIRNVGSIPGLERSPGGGHSNPLQYSCLENPMDRGAWQAMVHRVAKSQTQLKWLSMHLFLQQVLGPPSSFQGGNKVYKIRRQKGRMDMCICMGESIFSPPKTISTLLLVFTPIQNKKLKKKKSKQKRIPKKVGRNYPKKKLEGRKFGEERKKLARPSP